MHNVGATSRPDLDEDATRNVGARIARPRAREHVGDAALSVPCPFAVPPQGFQTLWDAEDSVPYSPKKTGEKMETREFAMKKQIVKQALIYIVGLFILALGVVFSINSDLGVSPVNSLPFAVHFVSGITMAITVTVFFLLCIGLQIALLRREFKWINLTQIIVSFIFGFFVDLARWIVGDFVIPTYAGQLTMLAISMVLIAIGLTLYLEAKLITLPSEGLILAIIQRFPQFAFHRVKIAMDCILVALAIVVTLIFAGGIYGAREGTVISAVLIGKLIPYVRKVIAWIRDRGE